MTFFLTFFDQKGYKAYEVTGVRVLLKYVGDIGVYPILVPFIKLINDIEMIIEEGESFKNPLKKVSGKTIIDWLSKELSITREESLDVAREMFNK